MSQTITASSGSAASIASRNALASGSSRPSRSRTERFRSRRRALERVEPAALAEPVRERGRRLAASASTTTSGR